MPKIFLKQRYKYSGSYYLTRKKKRVRPQILNAPNSLDCIYVVKLIFGRGSA
jgi:hypothetical protein